MAVAVVTDSTQYLPPELIAAQGIEVVSLYVKRGESLERESELLEDLTGYYARLREASDLPTTSQPSVGDFLACYEPLLQAGHDIVSLHLSSAVSGTFDSARQAQRQLEEGASQARIEVIDSRTTCGGLGLQVLAAADCARRGVSLAEVADHARRARDGLRIWFSVDSLEYLRRGGRIGGAQAWIGGALKIKPILSLESEVTPVERVRTAGRAFERMVEYMRELHGDGADVWCVQHIQSPDKAQQLVERGREIFGCDPIFVSEVGPVVGAYAGPGMIGVGGMHSSAMAAPPAAASDD